MLEEIKEVELTTEFNWLKVCSIVGFYEYGTELSVSTKEGYFFTS
jgi:hypothetical protein